MIKIFFNERTEIYKEKSDSWKEKALNMAKIILKNSKEKPLKSIKTFFPKIFKEGILKEPEEFERKEYEESIA